MKNKCIATGRVSQRIVAVLALMAILTAMICGMLPTMTAIAETEYTDVLEDLQKDSSFNMGDYTYNTADYSLKVIQVAEGADGELFVYVHQPSGQQGNLTATSINISTTIDEALSFTNYKLELLNSKGVFYKYKVKDFVVSNEHKRYYVITSIYRPFDGRIDAGTGNDNTITEVNYDVSKQFCITDEGISCVEVETITVTEKFVGYVRYYGGFAFFAKGACDSHFVAFSTDRPIDKLYEADVYYTKQTWSKAENTGITTSKGFSNYGEEYAYLKYTDKVSYTGPGIGSATFNWERIESVDDFIANVEAKNVYYGAVIDVTYGMRLTDEAKAELQKNQWVLRFAETPYLYEHYASGTWMYQERVEQTFVGDVTILRLKFETDGKVYNLGVIDNKQTGGKDPVSKTDVTVELATESPWLWTILALVLLVVLVIVLWPAMPYIAKFLVWLFSLPFKAIGSIAKAHNSHEANERRKERQQRKRERRKKNRAKSEEEQLDEYWKSMQQRKKKESVEEQQVDVRQLKKQLRSGERTFPLTRAEDAALGDDRDRLYDYVADNDIQPTKAAERKAKHIVRQQKRREAKLKRQAKKVDMDTLKKTVFAFGLDEEDLSSAERYAINRDEELLYYFAYKDQDTWHPDDYDDIDW